MELQIVSFEQAKALKELGFPQEEESAYALKDNVYGSGDYSYLESYSVGELIVDSFGFITDEIVSAPTLSLVAKWLRDKKHLSITISWMPNIKKYSCICGDMNYIPKEHSYSESYRMYNEKFTVIKDGNSRFISYEEALSAGIDKAIETLKEDHETNINRVLS